MNNTITVTLTREEAAIILTMLRATPMQGNVEQLTTTLPTVIQAMQHIQNALDIRDE
jgi:hypothetical protein